MKSSSKVKAPPLPPEVLQNLEKQGVTLDQVNKMLQGEASQIEQNRDILQQFSGLFNSDGSVNQGAVGELQQRINTTENMREQLGAEGFQQLQQALSGPMGQSILSGFQMPTDPSAQIMQQLAALDGGVSEAERDRLEKALKGELDPSGAIAQAEEQEFKRLKEIAGQRGIKIEGNNIFEATSGSTSGNQLIAQLRQSANVRRDTERQGIIQQATQSNLQRQQLAGQLGLGLGQLALSRGSLGLNQAQVGLQERGQNLQQQLAQFEMGSNLFNMGQPGQAQLGFLSSAMGQSTAPLMNAGLGLTQAYGQLNQPYIDQRNLEFQADLQSRANRTARYQGLFGSLGMGAGAVAGFMAGAPVGMPLQGAALGGGVGAGQGKAIGGMF